MIVSSRQVTVVLIGGQNFNPVDTVSQVNAQLSAGCNRKVFNRSKQEQLKSAANLRIFACLSQKRTCAVSSMVHRGQRSEESIEFRKAR
jgi:hypothetical protein